MAASELKTRKAVNVLVVDDHKMVRDGLRVMLNSLNKFLRFNVVESESGEEALKKISRYQFEIIIIDYQMPGLSGVETVCRILRFKPKMKILSLSNYDELAYIQSMMDAGANGYILKSIGPIEMLNAIKTVLSGRIYYCNDVAVKLIEAAESKEVSKEKAKKLLTRREIEVLQMIAMEMTNDDIAKKLFVAKRTVDTHRQNLLNKLQVKNSIGLVKVAYKLNLVK